MAWEAFGDRRVRPGEAPSSSGSASATQGHAVSCPAHAFDRPWRQFRAKRGHETVVGDLGAAVATRRAPRWPGGRQSLRRGVCQPRIPRLPFSAIL